MALPLTHERRKGKEAGFPATGGRDGQADEESGRTTGGESDRVLTESGEWRDEQRDRQRNGGWDVQAMRREIAVIFKFVKEAKLEAQRCGRGEKEEE